MKAIVCLLVLLLCGCNANRTAHGVTPDEIVVGDDGRFCGYITPQGIAGENGWVGMYYDVGKKQFFGHHLSRKPNAITWVRAEYEKAYDNAKPWQEKSEAK